MADIINKQGLFGSNIPGLLDKGIASLYDRDALVGLENEFGGQYGVQNTASGLASDARHMAAMNNLSNTLSNTGLGIAMGLPSEVAGDIGAFGVGLVNEIPALARGFNTQNLGEIVEDVKANYRGTVGTPNTATARGIYENVFSKATPQEIATMRGNPFANYGTAVASEVTPPSVSGVPTSVVDVPSVQEAIARARAQDFIDARAETKNATPSTPQESFFTSNPRSISAQKEKAAFQDLMSRMPGSVLEQTDVVETPKGLAALAQNFNPLGLIAGMFNPALGFAINMGSRAKSGLGSIGTKIGDFRERTTGYRTQAAYEAAQDEKSAQNRVDRMIDRITKGKPTRSNPRDAAIDQKGRDQISAAMQESRRGGQYTDKDSSGTGGSGTGKIVCTMMNERYGFGSFRNKIWMKFHEHHGPEYQKGYHAIFLPLVKIAKGEGKINTAVRKVLEHMGRHVTADMFKIMKGKKRDTLGRIYRAIFEPTCHIIGKIKSALGRG